MNLCKKASGSTLLEVLVSLGLISFISVFNLYAFFKVHVVLKEQLTQERALQEAYNALAKKQ